MASKQHPTPSRPCTISCICTVFQFICHNIIFICHKIYMYIPNFMKPAWHNCINKYVWQTFLCKNKIFKKHILFLETTII